LTFGFPFHFGKGSPLLSIYLPVIKNDPALKITYQPNIFPNGSNKAANVLARWWQLP